MRVFSCVLLKGSWALSILRSEQEFKQKPNENNTRMRSRYLEHKQLNVSILHSYKFKTIFTFKTFLFRLNYQNNRETLQRQTLYILLIF